MSPANNKKHNTRTSGFTLTEVLVATAIFVVVIAGVVGLFSGAVSTTQQGYAAIRNNEVARASLRVLEQDLLAAFSSRETGAEPQFYGRQEGMTFVGALSTGKIGRVTYVVNPNADTRTFNTIVTEPWCDCLGRARDQAFEVAYQRALNAGNDDDTARAIALTATNIFEPDFTNAVQAWANRNYGFGFTLPNCGTNPAPGTGPLIDLPVQITTYGVVRYEEEGRTDLDNFDLPKFPDPSFTWPKFDPTSPINDLLGPGTGPGDLPDGSPTQELWAYLVSAIRANNTDLRALMLQVRANQTNEYANPGPQLHGLTPETINKIIAAKRREIWLRMLADDPTLVGPGRLPSFWRTSANINDNRPLLRDYVISQRILHRAILLVAENEGPYTYPPLDTTAGQFQVDVLKVPGIFRYGYSKDDFDEMNTTSLTQNTLELLPGYTDFMRNPTGGAPLYDFDAILASAIASGPNEDTLLGTPIAPRLPALVQVRFWLMDEKPLLNLADFRRLYVQVMQVPSGIRRGEANQTAANS